MLKMIIQQERRPAKNWGGPPCVTSRERSPGRRVLARRGRAGWKQDHVQHPRGEFRCHL